MTFDIHQNIFDADGLPLEHVARAYQNELVGLFKQSPEGQALQEEGLQRGFDMQTEEGIDEWMRTYSAELVAGKGKPINLAGWKKQMGFGDLAQHIHILGAPEEDDVDADITDEPDKDLFDWVSCPYPRVASQSSREASTKQRNKMAKASRKKNRRRK